ncbi:hypothetical protein HOS33_gp171 [Erwinia phage vB_EamM_Y3]|uniref:Uncharacterized protein n=1 Tax=Erwinia phage vB_EamM_Y3 TaxID=1983553 RepID=A0A2H4IB85_9CAUD|nr:hypothetical protein HOS33_gp171 [Erwinia phage vB_EamM_Y3]ARW58811.1 hypothetical protein Y3_171 [Erwinia phage vB_EamM_Y3]QZE56034.1 hypothetical protein pEaSNUABM52_00176 [Erwinia phage pEp_SNUABM_52]
MKTCRLPKSPAKQCNITLTGTILSDILKRVDSVTRFSESADKLTHIHLLVTYKSDVFILGRTPDTFVAYLVPNATADSDTIINIDPVQLTGLINKRKELTVEFTGKELNINEVSGKYKSVIKLRPVSDEQIPMVETGLRHHLEGGHPMAREVIDCLTQGVRLTRLKDTITNQSIICRVVCDGKSVSIISPGHWTSSRYKGELKKKAEPFRFSLTGEMFDLIYRFCGEEKVTFHVDSTAFAAESDTFVLTLPPIQASDEDYRYMDNMLAQLGKPLMGCVVKGDLSAPFANISTLIEKKGNTNAKLLLKKKEFRLKFGNDSGSVQDSLTLAKPVERELTANLDLRIMRELLKSIGREERHAMGFHGSSINQLNAFSLNYKFDAYSLLYFGYLPA